tara:strand:+ start:55689 stop:57362 length:1674 start_codon:yes stop_codon:yes gene_type:complete
MYTRPLNFIFHTMVSQKIRIQFVAYQFVAAFMFIVLCNLSCENLPVNERVKKSKKILQIAVPSDPRTLDPAIAYDVVTWPLVRTLFNGLIDYDDNLNLIPWNAESWAISDDGCLFTFKLRSDIHFSNGRQVTSEDYIFSLERVLNPRTKSPGQGFYRNIEGAKAFQNGEAKTVSGLAAPHPTILTIKLTEPSLPFLYCLAMPFAYAVPKEEVNQKGDRFGEEPVGSGPFILEKWQRGLQLRLKKNQIYFKAEDIRLEGINLKIGGDETLHMMMFERGELDIANITSTGIPDPDFIRVKEDSTLRELVEHQPLNAIMYLSMNNEIKPFDKVKVRKAINYAINKKRIIKLISGRGIPAQGVLPPGMPGFNPKLRGYDYNPEKARSLLKQAGYQKGFSTELMIVAQSSIEAKIGQAVQQDLSDIGIDIELKPVTSPTRIQAASTRGSVPFTTFGWYQDYPDPSNFLDVLLNGKRITNINSNNISFYNNQVVNKLLEKAALSTNKNERITIYREVERMIVDDAPWVFLYHPQMFLLRQPWLKGIRINPVWPIRYELMWIDL